MQKTNTATAKKTETNPDSQQRVIHQSVKVVRCGENNAACNRIKNFMSLMMLIDLMKVKLLNKRLKHDCSMEKFYTFKQNINSAVLVAASLTIIATCFNASQTTLVFALDVNSGFNSEPMQEETFPDLSLSLAIGSGGTRDMGPLDLHTRSNSGTDFMTNHRVLNKFESGELIKKILRYDYSGEFSITELAISSVRKLLEEFGQKEQLDTSAVNENKVSQWLVRETNKNNHATGQQVINFNPMLEQTARELDLVYQTFWTQFIPIIESIVMRRPQESSSLVNLAFSCESFDELKALRQSASVSSIYGLFFDIFSTELYTHCLTRRMAIINLNGIKPTPIVRQFVEIYMDLSPTNQYQAQFGGSGSTSAVASRSLQAQEKLMSELRSSDTISSFNLKQSLLKHGPLEVAAEFVFDPSSGLALLGHKPDNKALVEKFKLECHMHIQQLQKAWSTTDELAALLSTSSNNLFAFNTRLKLLAPQLVYGSICAQLIMSQ